MKMKNEKSKRKSASQTAESTPRQAAGGRKRLSESIGLKNYEPVAKARRLDEVESLSSSQQKDTSSTVSWNTSPGSVKKARSDGSCTGGRGIL